MKPIKSIEQFKQKVQEIQNSAIYKEPLAFGICRVDRGQSDENKILQATYPIINWEENFGSAAIIFEALKQAGIKIDLSSSEAKAKITYKVVQNALSLFDPFISDATNHKNVEIFVHLNEIFGEKNDLKEDFEVVFLFEDASPKSVEAVYLKLYALSLNKAPLRSLNLDGAFGILQNVAWSGNYPFELDWLRENESELKLRCEYPNIDSVDKFPRFLQHIIPSDNTRILEASKVRMGAQIAAGTTVMPGASYINFNAGTTGPVMVEGRISSSAIVGSGSDIGGGASILGVLSGTDGNPISVGDNTLLGVNSVTGIPVGDGCIIDAGVAILAGTKIYITKDDFDKIQEVNNNQNLTYKEIFKGAELSNLNGIHFRQNSQTGQIIARRSVREIKLNDQLH